jgi:aspartate oxidase
LVFGHRVAIAAAKNDDPVKDELPQKLPDCFSSLPDRAAEFKGADLRRDLTWMMWHKVGLIRTEESLLEMRHELEKWLPLSHYHYSSPELNETVNMLLTAAMMTEAALLRRESRGCHYRSDYTEGDEILAEKQIVFRSAVDKSDAGRMPEALLVDKLSS